MSSCCHHAGFEVKHAFFGFDPLWDSIWDEETSLTLPRLDAWTAPISKLLVEKDFRDGRGQK